MPRAKSNFMRVSRPGWAVLWAVVAMVGAGLLPALHGLEISAGAHAHGHLHAAHAHAGCHHHHHAPTSDAPAPSEHDESSCPTCHLIRATSREAVVPTGFSLTFFLPPVESPLWGPPVEVPLIAAQPRPASPRAPPLV